MLVQHNMRKRAEILPAALKCKNWTYFLETLRNESQLKQLVSGISYENLCIDLTENTSGCNFKLHSR